MATATIPITALACARDHATLSASLPNGAEGAAMQTAFQKKLATIAQDQFDRFHLLRENQPPLSTQIQRYWQDLGFPFPGVGEAWSAVFVSWCVKNAGATASQFAFAQAHSTFVHAAIANTIAGKGVFHAHPPSDYAPKIGDLLQNNRAGNHFDFEFARKKSAYKSHSAIVIEVGTDNAGRYLRTIGGNESDTVGMKEVRLNANGRVRNKDGLYIAVVETLL
jgi:hypothetical protein